MQLKVVHHPYHPDDLGGVRYITITSLSDIVTIGAEVARGVREWLRRIPMTAGVKQRNFMVSAEWIEDAPKKPASAPGSAATRPKPKRKARK